VEVAGEKKKIKITCISIYKEGKEVRDERKRKKERKRN
jgi:hypothetical protein